MERSFLAILLIIIIVSSEGLAQTGDGWRVAIVDTGIFNDYEDGLEKMVGAACYSLQDQINHNVYTPGGSIGTTLGPFNGADTGGVDHYEIASMCPNGEGVSTQSFSSTLPRILGHGHGIGDPEGEPSNLPFSVTTYYLSLIHI